MGNATRSIGILYEHPEWFTPLFAELDRRGIRYDRVLASELHFDPSERDLPYSLVVNRMSPSAYNRGHEHAIFTSLSYLHFLDTMGVPVVNGVERLQPGTLKNRADCASGPSRTPIPRDACDQHGAAGA